MGPATAVVALRARICATSRYRVWARRRVLHAGSGPRPIGVDFAGSTVLGRLLKGTGTELISRRRLSATRLLKPCLIHDYAAMNGQVYEVTEKRRYRLRGRGLAMTRVQWLTWASAWLLGLAALLAWLLAHGLLARLSLVVASLALVTISSTIMFASLAAYRSDAAPRTTTQS